MACSEVITAERVLSHNHGTIPTLCTEKLLTSPTGRISKAPMEYVLGLSGSHGEGYAVQQEAHLQLQPQHPMVRQADRLTACIILGLGLSQGFSSTFYLLPQLLDFTHFGKICLVV